MQRRVTPETAICEGLAMMLHLARDLVARGGGQGPTAVARPIWGMETGARASSWARVEA